MKRAFLITTLFLFGLLLAIPAPSSAEEPKSSVSYGLTDLLVSPERIIFEESSRMAEIALINQSNRQLTYGISFIQYRMDENGGMKEIKEPAQGEQFADPYVRFTPRRVILEPRQTQMVRMMLGKPQNLADGEYRSHLRFSVIPESKEAAADKGNNQKGLEIQLIPIYGISIPVIVRQGSLNLDTRLVGLRLEKKADPAKPVFSFTIERQGTRSSFGDLEAEWKGKMIGQIRGIAVYTPNAKRNVSMQLSLPKDMVLQGGRLNLRYIDHSGGKENLLSENNLSIP